MFVFYHTRSEFVFTATGESAYRLVDHVHICETEQECRGRLQAAKQDSRTHTAGYGPITASTDAPHIEPAKVVEVPETIPQEIDRRTRELFETIEAIHAIPSQEDDTRRLPLWVKLDRIEMRLRALAEMVRTEMPQN
jgi:hypothetical protein